MEKLEERIMKRTEQSVIEIMEKVKTNPTYWSYGASQKLRGIQYDLERASAYINSALAGHFDGNGLKLLTTKE